MLPLDVVVAGAGMAGLAAALACSAGGARVTVLERAAAFGEVGAGIQAGPNTTRILHAWGLADAMNEVAAFPSRLQVRSAPSGRELGALPLGDAMVRRYGAPYATLHRADLHALLLQAVRQRTATVLRTDAEVATFDASGRRVQVALQRGEALEGDVLLGADGLWSRVRTQLLDDGPPRLTGHLAFRALVRQSALPSALRSGQVTVWLGPDLHLVQYPVRQGDWLNVVAIVHGSPPVAASAVGAGLQHWDHDTDGAVLRAALAGFCAPLQELVAAVGSWRLWVLCDRPPMQGQEEHGHGRVALLGDAAHPMRPYLAQGAGMALEDAAELGRLMAHAASDTEAALRLYRELRWRRNAGVQARAIRNGQVFHARGALRVARDFALTIAGSRLLDQPWLYGP